MAIAGYLKQSTAVTIKVGPFVDEDDGKTAEDSLTISQGDVRLSKNGGNMAQKNEATSLTHDEIGMYDCPINTTDTNTLGILTVNVHESGALPVRMDFMVLPANVWDSFFGADALQVHAVEIANDLITAASIAANAIGSAEIADGAITAAKIATGAVDADALAADAVSEIAAAIASPSINTTTIATLASQTSFTLTAGSADDNAYNGCVAVITDASSAVQKAVAVVLDYTGSTKTVTLLTDPAIFTMAVGDTIEIRPDRSLKPTVDNRTVDVDADGGVEVDTIQAGALTDIADAILKRDWTAVTGEASRSVLNALRFLRNKWSISGGTLTVEKEDDSTDAWTAAVSTTAGNPVSTIDPS